MRREYRLAKPVINGKQSRVWYVVWRQGRSCRTSTGTEDEAEAKRFLAAFRAAQERPPETYSITDLCEAYRTDRERAGIQRPDSLAWALRPVTAALGDQHPNTLTRDTIHDYIEDRRETVSDSTINKELRALRQAISWGRNNKWEMRQDIHIPAPAQAPARRRFLSEGEFEALMNAAETPHMRVFLSLAVWTAARSGAILRLKWADVDWERRIVWYAPEASGSKKRTRPIPINEPLMETLIFARRSARSPYVVEWRGKPVASIKTAFNRTAERAGVKDIRVHDLRRTAASWALQRGASFAEVAALLGDSEEVVRKHYAHFSPGYLGRVTELLAAHNAPFSGFARPKRQKTEE